ITSTSTSILTSASSIDNNDCYYSLANDSNRIKFKTKKNISYSDNSINHNSERSGSLPSLTTTTTTSSSSTTRSSTTNSIPTSTFYDNNSNCHFDNDSNLTDSPAPITFDEVDNNNNRFKINPIQPEGLDDLLGHVYEDENVCNLSLFTDTNNITNSEIIA